MAVSAESELDGVSAGVGVDGTACSACGTEKIEIIISLIGRRYSCIVPEFGTIASHD